MRLVTIALVAAACIALVSAAAPGGENDSRLQPIVGQAIAEMMIPSDQPGGTAVVVRVEGTTSFFNYGIADAANKADISSDSIFNLASVGKLFATTLLAQGVKQGELSLDDPVAKYVTELQQGSDIRRVTLGQLASHTSGLPRVPQHYEQWHRGRYSLADFMRFLKSWKADTGHEPGQQGLYSNAGIILLRIALERHYKMPFAKLMTQRLTAPLGMRSTALPLPVSLLHRAVQGYGMNGKAIGRPGEQQGHFDWPGAGQIYSSPRDMAVFLSANLGELEGQQALEAAMAFAQQGVFTVNPRRTQALAWQIVTSGNLRITDKNGGLNNTSAYIGLLPDKKIGVVVLSNRGGQPATKVGRRILHRLARETAEPANEGSDAAD
jgi:beta-lactamase class C